MIGATMLLLGVLEGFVGYSLPDDLLSGTGLRIADGLIKATPVVGTYLSFFLFGGEFPGDRGDPAALHRARAADPGDPARPRRRAPAADRLPQAHPVARPRPRARRNVVGYPFLPVYLAKSAGFFFMVFGITRADGRAALHQPGLEVRPLRPREGHRRLPARLVHGHRRGAAADLRRAGRPMSPATPSPGTSCCPGQVLPLAALRCSCVVAVPRGLGHGRRREHHLLQRPRDAPTRTAFMAAMVAAYGLLWAAGGNDILATRLHLSLNGITVRRCESRSSWSRSLSSSSRGRWCLGLQRADRDLLAARRGDRRDRALRRWRLLRAPRAARPPSGICPDSAGPPRRTRFRTGDRRERRTPSRVGAVADPQSPLQDLVRRSRADPHA